MIQSSSSQAREQDFGSLVTTLKRCWGYDNFRPHQEEVSNFADMNAVLYQTPSTKERVVHRSPSV
jgi:hypothetical protein